MRPKDIEVMSMCMTGVGFLPFPATLNIFITFQSLLSIVTLTRKETNTINERETNSEAETKRERERNGLTDGQ